ncbi:FadR/GntR family transcriptional regulator [Bacillus sp. OK048]|uniref:FadR/GntR family transcriptional regulator n=1 Tax=Bacillus sp. OK048 TaxID=1882761 RepID=UPI000886B851|nr:FadR/GntR family transcriptional regulator [Bacillus sp. OK048]SDM15745.1 GntR family transcriptional regulator, transcriptional repressor for pyruvate dehydrogenase complex [Bacillus sp. OK048]
MWEIQQVKPKNLYENVVEQLKEIISSGNLKPGDKIPSVRSLSSSFNVGQSTIREALSVLKTIGLIEARHGEGTFIRNFDSSILNQSIPDYLLITKEDIINLLDVRKILEKGTVAFAAQRRTTEDLIKIETAINQMESDLTSVIIGGEADWAFHFAIAEASQNKILISLMEHLSTTMQKAMKFIRDKYYVSPSMPEKLLAEHRGIFLAIKEQNVAQAEELILAHLVSGQDLISFDRYEDIVEEN